MNATCHVCGQPTLSLFPDYEKFKRITSDCKPWPDGGHLGICKHCSCVQVVTDEKWRREIAEIYRDYTIYFQGEGAEQSVFEQPAGLAAARSEKLIRKINDLASMPAQGRLLDVGCGNGGFLRSFNRQFPKWILAGLEYDDKYRSQVEAIPQVVNLFTGDLAGVPGMFDAISLIHVLEHIESPVRFLENIRRKLNPGGFLIIELPSYAGNPFELLIADHATHFDLQTIRALTLAGGLHVEFISSEWIPKEISLIARNSSPIENPISFPSPSPIPTNLTWLRSVIAEAGSVAARSPHFGLFGTSIAAGWLHSELPGKVSFFVDEDPSRIGKTHFSMPIYAPSAIPENSDVYVVLPPTISKQVAERLQKIEESVRFHQTPALP